MGWEPYIKNHYPFGTLKKNTPTVPLSFEDEPLVRFVFWEDKMKTMYFIRELNSKEKQKSTKLYKFIIHNFDEPKSRNISKEFNSNQELYKLIINYEACKFTYQRHFKIIKLLR